MNAITFRQINTSIWMTSTDEFDVYFDVEKKGYISYEQTGYNDVILLVNAERDMTKMDNIRNAMT